MSGPPGFSEHIQNYDPAIAARLVSEFSNYHRHGELYVPEDTPITVSLPTANAFVISTGWTAGLSTGTDHVVLDAANGTITIGDKGGGLYRIDIGTSFGSSRNNVEIHGEAWLNGVTCLNVGWRRTIGTANAVGNASDWGYKVLVPDDVLTFRFSSDVNTTTLTLDHGTFTAQWMAGE